MQNSARCGEIKSKTFTKKHSYTPRTVYPIRNHVTKSTRSALNVYKGTPGTNATCDARRYAVLRKATRAERNPKQCNSCWGLLFANKTSTHYGFAYLGVGRRKFVRSIFLDYLRIKLIITLNNDISFHVQVS